MLVASFLVGLPIFFEVGFVIMVPLVWNLARETKRSLLYYGLPMAAALTITHSLVPPHPAPAAASQLLGSDLGRTILLFVEDALSLILRSGRRQQPSNGLHGNTIVSHARPWLPGQAGTLTSVSRVGHDRDTDDRA